MQVTISNLVLSDAQIERVATRVAEILSERRDRAARAFLSDVQERGFETVMVEGIKALRETAGSQADRASAHRAPDSQVAGTFPTRAAEDPTGD